MRFIADGSKAEEEENREIGKSENADYSYRGGAWEEDGFNRDGRDERDTEWIPSILFILVNISDGLSPERGRKSGNREIGKPAFARGYGGHGRKTGVEGAERWE
jgi:hypothetical protein